MMEFNNIELFSMTNVEDFGQINIRIDTSSERTLTPEPILLQERRLIGPGDIEEQYRGPENDLLNRLQQFNPCVVSCNFRYDEEYNMLYLNIILDCDAKEALKAWLDLIDHVKQLELEVPVFIEWLGENNVEPVELGYWIGRALAKMGIFLETQEMTDAVEIVKMIRKK